MTEMMILEMNMLFNFKRNFDNALTDNCAMNFAKFVFEALSCDHFNADTQLR